MKKNKKKKKKNNYKNKSQNFRTKTPEKEFNNQKSDKLVNTTVNDLKNEGKEKKINKLVSETVDKLESKKEVVVNNSVIEDPLDTIINENGWNIDAVENIKDNLKNVENISYDVKHANEFIDISSKSNEIEKEDKNNLRTLTEEQVNHFINLVDDKIYKFTNEELNEKLSKINKDDGIEPSEVIIKQIKEEKKLNEDIKKLTEDKDKYEPSKEIVERFYTEQISNKVSNDMTSQEKDKTKEDKLSYYGSVNNKVRRLDSILQNKINHDDSIRTVDEEERKNSLFKKIEDERQKLGNNNSVFLNDSLANEIELNSLFEKNDLIKEKNKEYLKSNDITEKLYNTNISYDEMTGDPSDETRKIHIYPKEDLDKTRALGVLKPVDIDLQESDEMKIDESATEVLFDKPIHIEEKNSEEKVDDNISNIIGNVAAKEKNSNYNFIIWLVVGIVILAFILLNIFSKGTVLNKFITNLSVALNIKEEELLNFELKFNTSGNKYYNFLNDITITGNYESNKKQFYNFINVNNKNSEKVINFNYLTQNSNGYIYDSDISEKYLKFNNDYDFSINSFKKNIISFLKQINGSHITDYISNSVNGIDNELVLLITDTNILKITDELKTIKLDSLYQDLLNKLIDEMLNNSSKYSGTKISLNMNVIGGFKKLVISGKENITLTNDNNTCVLEIIDEDNAVTTIKVNKDNIIITKSRGSIVDLSLSIDMVLKEGTSLNKLTVDEEKIIDMNSISSQDEFNVKKSISSSIIHNNFINLYYYINGQLNTINMNVSNNDYYVYYKVPDGYNSSNYNSVNQKKYIDIDRTVIYSLRNYTYTQTLEYINSEYQKEINSLLYYDVKNTNVLNIKHNDMEFNYQIVTKTYDSNYENYDTTSSTLYIWNQLNENTIFMIEYEFQGNTISEENISKLLDIQVG